MTLPLWPFCVRSQSENESFLNWGPGLFSWYINEIISSRLYFKQNYWKIEATEFAKANGSTQICVDSFYIRKIIGHIKCKRKGLPYSTGLFSNKSFLIFHLSVFSQNVLIEKKCPHFIYFLFFRKLISKIMNFILFILALISPKTYYFQWLREDIRV